MIFYKGSICPIALDFFSLFYFKKVKVYRLFLFRVNIYFIQIYTECCPIICSMLWTFQLPQHLLSSIQRLLSCNTLFCIRQVRYLSPTFLHASTLRVWRKRRFKYPPRPTLPTLPKKGVFILYNKIFPNILCKISISSVIFDDALTKI